MERYKQFVQQTLQNINNTQTITEEPYTSLRERRQQATEKGRQKREEAKKNKEASKATKKGDPVIISTGSWTHGEVDLSIPYFDVGLNVERRYGNEVTGGTMGDKWAWNWESRIIVGGARIGDFKASDEYQKIIEAYNELLPKIQDRITSLDSFLKPGTVQSRSYWPTSYRDVAAGVITEASYNELSTQLEELRANLVKYRGLRDEAEVNYAEALEREAYADQVAIQNMYSTRGV